LEGRGLQLDPLLRRRDVGHAAADLLEALELLLVGQVERFPGILGLVEQFVGLGLEYSGKRFITPMLLFLPRSSLLKLRASLPIA